MQGKVSLVLYALKIFYAMAYFKDTEAYSKTSRSSRIFIYIYIYIFAPRSLPGCCCWRPALHVGAMVAMPQLRQPPWPWPWPCGWAWLAFSSDRQASPVPKPKTSRRQVFSGFTTSLHFASLSSELHVLFALPDSMRIDIYICFCFLCEARRQGQSTSNVFKRIVTKNPKLSWLLTKTAKFAIRRDN